jgi:hypothetical protein
VLYNVYGKDGTRVYVVDYNVCGEYGYGEGGGW